MAAGQESEKTFKHPSWFVNQDPASPNYGLRFRGKDIEIRVMQPTPSAPLRRPSSAPQPLPRRTP